jgi:amidophosphoribosyltransferase
VCGIVGIFGHPEAAKLSYLGLYALQHRGQESAGIVAAEGPTLTRRGGMGHVADVFSREVLDELKGPIAIGQVRYSTCGDSNPINASAVPVAAPPRPIAVAHNGNLVDAAAIRADLEADGAIFQTTTRHRGSPSPDRALARSGRRRCDRRGLPAGARSVLARVRRAGARRRRPGPMGFRRSRSAGSIAPGSSPASRVPSTFWARKRSGTSSGARSSSSTSAASTRSSRWRPPARAVRVRARLLRAPDSMIFGQSVQAVRKRLGAQLAKEQPADVDLIVPVPDSGTFAGLGYAAESKIPFELGLVRNHYVGRTFIEPSQQIRNFGVRVKLNPVRETLAGKAHRADRRQPRPGDDEPEDRPDVPGRRAPKRFTCASRARRRSVPATTGSTRRAATS